MVLHLGAVVKLKLSAALRCSVLSPAALITSFIVKILFRTDWVRRELNNASRSVRLFLFRMSRIAFSPMTNQDNDPGSSGRLKRAILLVRRSVAARPTVQDEGSYNLLSMTAL